MCVLLKSDCPSICQSVRAYIRPPVNKRLSQNLKTAEANFMNLHRKIKLNEKTCRAQELGYHAQGQGHNGVKGQFLF